MLVSGQDADGCWGRALNPVSPLLFVLLADQRFGCFRDKVALERGSQTRVSVCYLSFLPESRNVGTVVLVDEASGNRTLKLVRNFSATFTVKEPGSYHFEASTAHGIINSTSFNVTLEGMYSVLLNFLQTLTHPNTHTAHTHGHMDTHMGTHTHTHTCSHLHMHSHE